MGKALFAAATRAVHKIARIQGEDAAGLTVGVDCDAVTIHAAGVVLLGRAAQEEFTRAYFEAVRQAEAWAERYGGGGNGG